MSDSRERPGEKERSPATRLRASRDPSAALRAGDNLLLDFLGSTHAFAWALDEVMGRRLLQHVAGERVTFSQLKLLKLVDLTDAHPLSDVAAFLGISRPAASKAVDRLVRRKLIRRTEGEPDRRAVALSLTERGHHLLNTYESARNKRMARIFRSFAPAELRRTADLLDRMSAGMVDHHAKAGEICLQCGIYFRRKCLLRELLQRNCFYQRFQGRGNGRRPAQSHEHTDALVTIGRENATWHPPRLPG